MAGTSDEYVEIPGSVDSDDYQAFLDDYTKQSTPRPGELLHGHVLSVSDKEVIVDIGRKIEGLVPASQFPQADGRPGIKPGEQIEVMIDRSGAHPEGYILLSYERAHSRHVWEDLEKAAADGTAVKGRVVSRTKAA